MATDVPPGVEERLCRAFDRLVSEAPESFKAGQLSQQRIESVLGHSLEYSIPLRLREIVDDGLDLATRVARPPRAFDEKATAEFNKHVASGALVPVQADKRESTLYLPLF